MAVTYDPFAPEFVADPYPWYRRLRDEGPVHHHAGRDIWLVSRYRDVRHVTRNPATFSSRGGSGLARRPAPLINSDPPEHERLRRLVQRHLTGPVVETWRPRVEQVVESLLDAAFEAERVDLVATVANPLPMTVITELLGLPPGHQDTFRRWSNGTLDVVAGHLDGSAADRVEADVAEFARFVAGEVVERGRGQDGPGSDVVGTVVAAAQAQHLSPEAAVFLLMMLFMAGHVTTTGLVGNLVLSLLSNPAEWEAVTDDAGLVGPAVEESLRHDSPTQGLFRTVRDDVDLDGTSVPAGARLFVLFGSANRDERRYPDPDAFLVRRNPSDHLAFGSGIHVCVGARLARLEASVLLRSLVRRARSIELDGDVVYATNPLLRGLRHLPVRLKAR